MTSEPRSTQSAPPRGSATVAAGPDPAEYGPRGYLPDKAARRARKIVLRAPMGLQWPVAAAATAVVVAIVGVVYLVTTSGAPGAPFVPAGALEDVDPRGAAVLELPDPSATGDHAERVGEVLVVRGGGGLAAFAAPPGGAEWCDDSRRLEGGSRVWTAEGRLVGGDGASLRPLSSRVHAGTLYIDPTSPRPAFPPAVRGETPVCT